MDTHQAEMLLLLTVGAFAMPILAERIGWFAAPCEVLYGAVVATVVPGADQPGDFVTALANFGVLLLLFLAGLDIDFSLLLQRGQLLVTRAALAAAGMQCIGLVIGVLLGWSVIQVLLINAFSVSLLLVVLKQADLSQSTFGQTVLLVGVAGEFLSITTLTIDDLLVRHGLAWQLAIAGVGLLAVLGLGVLVLHFLALAVTTRPETFRRLFAHADPSEIGVRAALALMMGFAALAILLGVEPFLATFVAGVACSFTFRTGNRLFAKLSTLGYGFFVPIFFITAGLGVHLVALLSWASIGYMLAILLGTISVRLLAVPLLRMVGLAWKEAVSGAFLLATPLTLQVTIAQVGIATGQVSGELHGVVLGAAVAGALVFPLFGRPFLPRTDRSIALSGSWPLPVRSALMRARLPR